MNQFNDIENEINSELVQLVYFGKLSYVDLQFMTYKDRVFWFKEIEKIMKMQNNVNTSDEFKGFS